MDLQEALRRSQYERADLPDVFDINCGLGDYPELGVKGIPSWGKKSLHKQRCVILEIRTWKGVSWNAIHYYGKLIIDGVYASDVERPEYSKNLTREQEKQYPLLDYTYDLKIKRPLTKREKEDKETYGDRFEYWEEGDLIDGYEDMSELIEDAKEIMKLRFQGNWHFYYETPRGNKNKIEL